MNMLAIRVCTALAIVIILLSRQLFLLAYVAVFHGSIEFLNSRRAYRAMPEHRRYNAIFIGFVLFIVLNRTRAFRFDDRVEFILNLLEHGSFALVICLNLLCYMMLLGRWSHRMRMLIVVLLFNLIGVVNEVFQNALNDRYLWYFESDAMKDIAVNTAGSLIFLFVVRSRKDLGNSEVVVGSE